MDEEFFEAIQAEIVHSWVDTYGEQWCMLYWNDQPCLYCEEDA